MKILIIGNEHPNEVAALITARMFYKLLKRKGYDVVLETAPPLLTDPLGIVLSYMRGIYSLEDIGRFGRGKLIEDWLDHVRAEHSPDKSLNFHSQVSNTKKPYLQIGIDIIVEVPSFYKPINNSRFLKASEDVLRVLYEDQEKREFYRWYVEQVSDIRECRRNGYFTEESISQLLELIRPYIP